MTLPNEAEAHDLSIYVGFGPSAGVKWRRPTLLFKQPPSLVPYLNPLLIGVSVAPFVKQTSTGCDNLARLVDNRAPVRRKVQKPSDYDGIELSCGEGQSRSFGDNPEHASGGSFVAKMGQHLRGGLDRDHTTPVLRQRNRDPAGTRADVKHARAVIKPSRVSQALKPFV